jgi:site-specific DNA-methyltransferase (adenine-specific)
MATKQPVGPAAIWMRTSALVPWADNPKHHDPEQIETICTSIQATADDAHQKSGRRGKAKLINGFGAPLLVRLEDSEIVAGHGRVLAAEKLGLEWLPVRPLDISAKQAHRLARADNRLAELAPWDNERLLEQLQADIDEDGPGALLAQGFSDVDVASLLAGDGLPELGGFGDGDSDDDTPLEDPPVGEPPKDPVTKLGDVWELGRHVLACGDCRSSDVYPKQADAVITDPPYGVSYADKNAFLNAFDKGNCNQKPIESDHGSVDDIAALWRASFGLMCDATKPGGAYYMTGPQGGDLSMMMMMMQEAGWLLKHVLIWVKNNHVLGRCDYNYKHEPILYGWKPGAGHYFGGSGSDTSVWEFDRPHRSEEHPTMKPVALFAHAMKRALRRDETVLDAFVGSGTTLLAAEQLGRKCHAIELDPGYCDVTIDRWEQLTGSKATRKCLS